MIAPAKAEKGTQLEKYFQPIENAAAIFAAVTMLVAMLLVSADALMRYVFNAPLTFQYYLTEKYLMVVMVTMPMAWGFRTGGYIRIEGLVQRLSAPAHLLVLRVGLVVSSLYIAVLAWVAGVHWLEAYHTGEVQFGVIDWPVSWSWIWVPVGLGLLAVRLLMVAFGPVKPLLARHNSVEDEI